MPFYNHFLDWNGLEVDVQPAGSRRKRVCIWPYFVGQRIQLELRLKKATPFEKNDLQFHFVEKMADVDKPRLVAPTFLPEQSTDHEKVFELRNGSRITGKGEVKYWLSSRGYNVDHEPVFSTEAVSLDSLVIPLLVIISGPLFGFVFGLLLGLLLGK